MANVNLKTMEVAELLALRGEIDAALEDRSRALRDQLAQLEKATGRTTKAAPGQRSSTLKGIKVPPKFVGPNGETWAGRGARPKWLAELLEAGHAIEEFAVGETGAEDEAPEEEAAPRAKRGAARKGARRRK
ncbi:regulator [Rhodoplanes elegans]|uniref:Regulator n=1 Tax=Rhodoplanes elegans TaxID=29408 RepID=A0A327KML1_9BRAD|nr:H-NS histone family protein [Rhodoplanes elegans]MBK5956693.1 regulator [Rhodoplanes elegans]RAI39204.1 regulator [Rhodoplanes elegans]